MKASWSLITSSLIQRLVIRPVLFKFSKFNIVTNNQDDGLECTLTRFTHEK